MTNPYKRTIKGVEMDVYEVLHAYKTGNPALDHAAKKILAPGTRGHKDRTTDLQDIYKSVRRALQLEGVEIPVQVQNLSRQATLPPAHAAPYAAPKWAGVMLMKQDEMPDIAQAYSAMAESLKDIEFCPLSIPGMRRTVPIDPITDGEGAQNVGSDVVEAYDRLLTELAKVQMANPEMARAITSDLRNRLRAHHKDVTKLRKTHKDEGAKEYTLCPYFNGKTVVITGNIVGGRQMLRNLLQASGAKVRASVSSSTDILIVGYNPGGGKKAAAVELGIELMPGDQAFNMFVAPHLPERRVGEPVDQTPADPEPASLERALALLVAERREARVASDDARRQLVQAPTNSQRVLADKKRARARERLGELDSGIRAVQDVISYLSRGDQESK